MKKITLCILNFYLLINIDAQNINPFEYNVTKKAKNKNGMVVCAHPLASKVGISMLQKGGNAVDAIIATQLALAVVYPIAGNIGGGGFMIIRFNDGKIKVIDFREIAPGLAHAKMYLDSNGNLIKDLSVKGHLASGVPGTIAGIFHSLQYSKLPIETLIQPAIDLARKGFAITQKEANMLNLHKDFFIKNNRFTPIFVKNTMWKKGDTLIQQDLANTLERIKKYGEKEFYQGETANLIVDEMKNGKGLISKEDLKKYSVTQREPFVFNYKKKYTIITMPPPSSGGFVLNQVLKMIEYKPTKNYSFHSPEAMNLIIEAERRAFADRAKYIGDPSFIKIPLKKLLDSQYLQSRINTNFITKNAGSSEQTKYGIVQESEETTHLSAVDKDRNVVVVTTTLNGNYGCFTVVKGAGFLLNNEMDDFTTKLGEANMYGAIGEEKNLIEPYKKMLSSMSPTIVLKNNQFHFSVGSPGGTRIPTSVLQTILNIIDFKKSPLDAVNLPRFHHQWLPDVVDIEEDFSVKEKKALLKMGYKINQKKSMGKVEVIYSNGKILEGIGDKRGDDSAEGY